MGIPNIEDVDMDMRGKVEDLLVKHGISDAIPLTNVNKEKAMQDLLVAEVLITRTVALDSFFKGLNFLGLGDLLRKYQSITCYVIPSKEEVAIDHEVLKARFQQGKADCSNGNESGGEEQTRSWEWFLKFIDEAASIQGTASRNCLLATINLLSVVFISSSENLSAMS